MYMRFRAGGQLVDVLRGQVLLHNVDLFVARADNKGMVGVVDADLLHSRTKIFLLHLLHYFQEVLRSSFVVLWK